MKHEMYAIRDRLNGFTPPIPINDDEIAQRWFREMVHTSTTMKLSPSDFDLWHLGTWDSETGETINNVYPVAMKGGANGNNTTDI